MDGWMDGFDGSVTEVVRLAQLARPDGLGSGVEEDMICAQSKPGCLVHQLTCFPILAHAEVLSHECDRIHEAWTHAARRLDAVVCSLHMRCEAQALQ
eukprot:4703232-Amphidinium_carterae.4